MFNLLLSIGVQIIQTIVRISTHKWMCCMIPFKLHRYNEVEVEGAVYHKQIFFLSETKKFFQQMNEVPSKNSSFCRLVSFSYQAARS